MILLNLEIFGNPNVANILSILSVVFGLISVYLVFYFLKFKLVFVWGIDNSEFLNEDLKGFLISHFQIDNLRKSNIYETKILITNIGNYCFQFNDFQSEITIEFFNNNLSIIDYEFLADNKFLNIELIKRNEKSISFKFSEFEKRNNILIKIRYDSESESEAIVSGKIRGLKEINERIEKKYPNMEEFYLTRYRDRLLNTIFLMFIPIYISYLLFKLSFNKSIDDLINYIKFHSWSVFSNPEFLILLLYFFISIFIAIRIFKFIHYYIFPIRWRLRNIEFKKLIIKTGA